ncbi:MAG: hypothetical protein ACI4K6_06285 [Candidatus Fimenecus sp.]
MVTQQNADWLEWIADEKFNDADLFRIVKFFVFHSPCPNLSARGKSLHEYGWNNPWKNPYWLNKQLCQVSSSQKLVFSSKTVKDIDSVLAEADLLHNFPHNFERERICIYDNKSNQFMSIFYHIRNALAHGRLNMKDIHGSCIFVFEDVKKRGNELFVTARMIIKKETLLKWIDIIEQGEKIIQKASL